MYYVTEKDNYSEFIQLLLLNHLLTEDVHFYCLSHWFPVPSMKVHTSVSGRFELRGTEYSS